jgi:hypothetical protein
MIKSGSDTDPLAEAIAAFRRGDYYRDRPLLLVTTCRHYQSVMTRIVFADE